VSFLGNSAKKSDIKEVRGLILTYQVIFAGPKTLVLDGKI